MDRADLKQKIMTIHNDLMVCEAGLGECVKHENSCADCEADKVVDLFVEFAKSVVPEKIDKDSDFGSNTQIYRIGHNECRDQTLENIERGGR